jgi:hypothetical protein
LVLVALALAGARPARAAGEDEWQLSARLGGANATGSPFSPWGLAAGLDVEYGLTDAWSARATVETLAHPVDAVKDVSPAGTRRAIAAILGATYTVDVIRLVPYITGGLGILRWTGPGEDGRLTMALDLGVGADYLLTPRWAVGASALYLFAPSDLLNNFREFGEVPLAFSLTARVSHAF